MLKRMKPQKVAFRKKSDKIINALEYKKNIITLIRFYGGHECLWNPQNPDYYDIEKKNILWNWITKQFGNSVQKKDIKCFLEKLQEDAFYNRIVRKKCLQSGVPYPDEGDVGYLKEFDFLDKLIKPDDEVQSTEYETKSDKSPVTFANNNDFRKKGLQTLPYATHHSFTSDKFSRTDFNINKVDISSEVNILCDGIRNKLCTLPIDVFARTQRQILKIISKARTEISNENFKSPTNYNHRRQTYYFFGSIKKNYHSLVNIFSNKSACELDEMRPQRSNAFNYRPKPICHLLQDEATIIKLIALYRENECLWNPSCSNFKNPKEQEICWQRIAKAIDEDNLSVMQVKRKINVLRRIWENDLTEMREKILSDDVETDPKISASSESDVVEILESPEQDTTTDKMVSSSLQSVLDLGDSKNGLETENNNYLTLNPQIKEIQINNLCNIIRLDLQNVNDDELFYEAKWRIIDILRETQLKQLHNCNIELNGNRSKEEKMLHLTNSDDNQTTL